MKYKHVFFISPPFYSHFNPLLTLAKSFKAKGAKISFACSREFQEKVLEENLDFYELDISKNKNLGSRDKTLQADSEEERLEEFFSSTREGAIETLITQSQHRKADMLFNPEELIEKIRKADESLQVDLYVVDILSYSVTLSLYFLELDFITFCPPHPRTIPREGEHFNLPKDWPRAIDIDEEKLGKLEEISKDTEKEFTRIFNSIISKNKNLKAIDNAFSLVSEIATIYNYFDFYGNEELEEKPLKIFIGNAFQREELKGEWLDRVKVKEKKIMISLGTFLSNRKDVLEKLILGTRKIYPKAVIIVSGGSNAESLKEHRSANTFIEDFIPQKALIPFMDTVIFHGGCDSFTESIYYAKDMIILPFSSDQFNIAYDCEKNKLAEILDPNNFQTSDLNRAFKNLENKTKKNLNYWSEISRERGGDYGADIILDLD